MGGSLLTLAFGANDLTPPNHTADAAPDPAQVAAALRQAKAKLQQARARQSEPLAVVGVGCRVPGAADIDAYWQMLAAGQTHLSRTPAQRWDASAYAASEPKQAGKITCDRAGYIDQVDEFDAQFFGLSNREAASLDPQHRLLFEIAWETLEHAAINPDRLRGSRAGVFVGLCSNDYLQLLGDRNLEQIDAYLGTGNAHSSAAGRLSYFLDWRGPAVAVDTACSSSLTAIHFAAQSLRNGECDLALAGGVNLMLSPELSINLSRAGMLSSSGLCRAFCRGGDGFVRGEGCGLVLLKRLSQARADGDRVLCVVRGTAVNQDGRSNGLTAPNGPAQQAVIGQALAASRLKPSDIDYLEAHGTGTELGDPTEMGAIGHVFGHRDTPLMIGSAKANIGHLEGAAGVAGLIKTCLALAHQGVPPHPLLEPDSDGPNGPSPHIDWSLPIEIPTQLTPWPRREGHVRRAGVSSFGFGGTNAHAILEEAPLEEAPEVEPEALNEEPVGDSLGGLSSAALDAPRWVTLSARTPTALAALAERYASDLPDAPLEAIAYAANTGRAAHAERLAIRATSRAEFINRLTNWQDEPSPHVARGAAPRARSTGWLFGGQGGCRPGMGRELYARYPVFRQTWDAADQVIRQHWPRNLATICWEEPDKHLAGVDAQVALVAWQIALAQLWRSWAGAPAWVVGHSLGELAAAVTAGMLERDDALRLVCRRAELLDSITEDQRGRMLAVMATVDQVTPLLGDELSIAAENGPRQTVVSGSEAALAELAEKLTDKRLRTRPLATSHAFHSHLIEPILDEFKVACARIPSQPPTLGFLSTLTGQPIETALPPDYWADQLRGTVRFSQAINGAADDSQLLELSPTPVLRSLTQRDVASAAGWKQDEAAQVAEASAAQLWTAGVAIDFKALHPPQRLSVSLPTYPFERQRHWFAAQTTNRPVIAGEAVHPLLGRKLDVAGEAVVFETDLAGHAWLADHKLRDRPTLPAVAYLELAWAAARCVNGGQALGEGQAFEVRDLELERPLVFGPGAGGQEDNGARVQTLLTPDGEGFRVEVLQRQPQGWRRMAHARLNPATTQPVAQPAAAPHVDRQVESRTQPPTITNPLTSDLTDRDIARHYADCRDAGLDYGPAFQAITKLSGGESCATATLNLPQAAPSDGYLLPPPMADAALQAIAAAIPKIWNAAFVPKSVKIASLLATGESRDTMQVVVSLPNHLDPATPPNQFSADIFLNCSQGTPVAELRGVTLVRLADGKNPAKAVTTRPSTVKEDEKQAALATLANASADERPGILLDHVRRRLAIVMDMTVEELHPAQPLDTLGLDSLMAFELRDDLEESLGVDVPMDVFLQRMTLEELADIIAGLFDQRPETPDEASGDDIEMTENWIEGAL